MAERIFYATHTVTLQGTVLKGVQSVSLNGRVAFEPVFQLGQCEPVDYLQNPSEAEVTITRSLVGGSALGSLTLNNASCAAAEALLNAKKTIIIGAEGGGFEIGEAQLTGYSVTFGTDGVFTEELSYVGTQLSAGGGPSALNDTGLHLDYRPDFTGPAGAISARMNVTINRQPIFKLGQFQPVDRFIQFPIECTAEIGYLLSEGGSLPEDPTACSATTFDVSQTFGTCDASFTISNARLTGISYSGGDAGAGGNVTVNYSYTSYNNFSIA